MQIIQSTTKLPYLEKTSNGYNLNANQREITIKDYDGEKETEKKVWEIYQETFKRFPTVREKLEAIKSAVRMYAQSDAIKKFTLGTTQGWLDSEQRASIKDAINAHIDAGETEYTIWLNNKAYTMTCEKALSIISALELYSSKCYNITAKYLNELESCGTDIEKACNIDFTQGYPDKITFTL